MVIKLILNLKEKWKTLSQWWKSKTSRQKWRSLYSIPDRMLRMVGVRVFTDCQLNWYSHLGNVLVFYYMSMILYTLYYYNKKDQFLFGCRCLCGTGITISSIPIYYRAIGKERFRLRNLLTFAGRFIYQPYPDSTAFGQLCEFGVKKLAISYLILTLIICFSMSIVCIGPMLFLIETGVWITPLGLQFPYADESTVAFILDIIIQLIVGLIGVPLTVALEMASVIINNAVEISSMVIEININRLCSMLQQMDTDPLKLSQTFHNIIIQIQDYDRYIQELSHIYYYRFFYGPFALGFGTAFCVFAKYHWDFPAGYGVGLASYIQLLILCYMGYNVQKANETILDALNRVPWYLLPNKRKTEYLLVLSRIQSGKELNIGPFGILNYEMATDITKRIYSILTMMIEFTK